MIVREQLRLAIGVGLLLPALGCASIVSGQNATVKIDSYPPNANVVIRDKHGADVATVMTPATVSLRRGDRMFLPAKYTATVSAPGYEAADFPIRSTLNPWLYGNIVVGGLPGLIVDGATGALWKPSEEMYAQHLKPLEGTEQPPSYTLGQANRPAALWPVPAQPSPQYDVLPTAFYPTSESPAVALHRPALLPTEQASLLPAAEPTPWPRQSVSPDAY